MEIIIKYIKWIWDMNLPLLAYETLYRWITGRMIIHKILPGLYQSSKFSRKDRNTLMDLNIKAIIDVEGGVDELMGIVNKDDYKFWPFKDEPNLPDLAGLKQTASWGYNKWQKGRKNLLVHCAAGHNRSGLVNGVILTLKGMSGKEAIELIQSKVPGALVNRVFREYLETL